MSNLNFAETHNMLTFLEKPIESDRFEEIIDFLNASSIRYALMVNPTIYTSCIKQFWATAKAKIVNGEVQIQSLVDRKKVIVTEASVRRDLQLADENGTKCLPNATIFSELERMGAKTTAWNEFSSTMASAIIYLATTQKFNFPKYIFENMVKNLEGGIKFLMYPRFVQVFLDKQVGEMFTHNKTSDAPYQQEEGEGSAIPTDPHPTPTINQPSSSQPQKKQTLRKSKKKNTEVPQLSGSTNNVADENEPTHSNDPLLSEGLGLETSKTAQAQEISSLKQRVKKLKNKKKSRPHGLRRLYKVGRSRRVESSEESLGDQEDASKQGRKIHDIDADAEQEVKVEKVVSTAKVTTASATTTTVDELTLAHTLIKIKAAKPKAVTTAATTVTPISTRPRAKGIIFHDQEEQAPASTPIVSSSQSSQAKDKGKKLVKQREEDANISEWDDVQAMMDTDYELAARLQAEEQGELTIKEKSRLFVELMDKRKKHFAKLRGEE
ncbi:hypothetical protein Tco_0169365 [Tanacetum coccineum]